MASDPNPSKMTLWSGTIDFENLDKKLSLLMTDCWRICRQIGTLKNLRNVFWKSSPASV